MYWKTTITIYSTVDPRTIELSDLAEEAEEGDAICTRSRSRQVERGELPDEARAFFDEEDVER